MRMLCNVLHGVRILMATGLRDSPDEIIELFVCAADDGRSGIFGRQHQW